MEIIPAQPACHVHCFTDKIETWHILRHHAARRKRIGVHAAQGDFGGAVNPTDRVVLGDARLRELYYAVLKGEAGIFARQAFGVDNTIARSIAHVSSRLDAPISIDDMATRAGMSRAVFHRKFKQVTTMAPTRPASAG